MDRRGVVPAALATGGARLSAGAMAAAPGLTCMLAGVVSSISPLYLGPASSQI